MVAMGRARPVRARIAAWLVALLAIATPAGCAVVDAGHPSVGNANLAVAGDSGDAFDTEVKNALSDVIAFWRQTYPTLTHGTALPPLRGKLYSLDGDAIFASKKVPAFAKQNACVRQNPAFIIDNAAYCPADDSIMWDRGSNHLLPVLADAYGPVLVALVFAHEFGHAIQHRLGSFHEATQVIQIESQADCAAGAFAAYALAGHAPHVPLTPASLDGALEGYFQVRDPQPGIGGAISHGNGFDRISALQNGIEHGASYCYSSNYYTDLTYTERPYVDDSDYANNGNEPLAATLRPNGPATYLNRFWASAATTVHSTLRPVRLTEAAEPACGSADPASQFGYCPDDNTVSYSASFAHDAYYSISSAVIDPHTAVVRLARHQPGDFALGQLLSIAWGMAARHQFFGKPVDDRAALLAAVCYSGAFAKSINLPQTSAQHPFVLSPPDLDEATSAVLQLVPLDTAFGARGTTGLQRVRSFVTGYQGGLSSC